MSAIGSISSFFNRPRFSLILVPSTLFFLSVFITLPLASQVVISLVCKDRNSIEDDDCSSTAVSKYSSLVALYSEFALNVPSFFSAGFYGLVANRYGRKICMTIPILGYLAYMICVCYVCYYEPPYYVATILIGCILFGLCGSFNTFQMATFSYLSDITASKPMQERARFYSILEGFLYISKVIGPLMGGIWAKKRGFFEPLVFSFFITVAALVWTICFVKESYITPSSSSISNSDLASYKPTSNVILDQSVVTSSVYNIKYKVEEVDDDGDESNSNSNNKTENSEPVSIFSFANTFKTFLNIKWLMTKRSHSGISPVPFLFTAFFFFYITVMAEGFITIFYLKLQFKWDSDYIGYFLATEAFIQILSMVAVPELVHWIRGRTVPDVVWILLGYLSRVYFVGLFPLVTDIKSLYALTALLILSGPPTPRTRSVISNSVPQRQQTKALSAFSAIQALSLMVSPVFTAGYAASIDFYPGLMFFCLSGICIISSSLIIFVLCSPNIRKQLPGHELYINQNGPIAVRNKISSIYIESSEGVDGDADSIDYTMDEPLLSSHTADSS